MLQFRPPKACEVRLQGLELQPHTLRTPGAITCRLTCTTTSPGYSPRVCKVWIHTSTLKVNLEG